MNKFIDDLLNRYPCMENCRNDIITAFTTIIKSYENNGKLLLCGNGGSASDCSHFVGELMKGFLKKRPLSVQEKSLFNDDMICNGIQKGLKAIDLCSQSSLLTAVSNDVMPELIFAQQVYTYADKNDVLFLFSTSGMSENIICAAKTAKAVGIKTIGITGKNKSTLSDISDVCIRLPETETFKIQELTLPVYHALAAAVEDYFFES